MPGPRSGLSLQLVAGGDAQSYSPLKMIHITLGPGNRCPTVLMGVLRQMCQVD